MPDLIRSLQNTEGLWYILQINIRLYIWKFFFYVEIKPYTGTYAVTIRSDMTGNGNRFGFFYNFWKFNLHTPHLSFQNDGLHRQSILTC